MNLSKMIVIVSKVDKGKNREQKNAGSIGVS